MKIILFLLLASFPAFGQALVKTPLMVEGLSNSPELKLCLTDAMKLAFPQFTKWKDVQGPMIDEVFRQYSYLLFNALSGDSDEMLYLKLRSPEGHWRYAFINHEMWTTAPSVSTQATILWTGSADTALNLGSCAEHFQTKFRSP